MSSDDAEAATKPRPQVGLRERLGQFVRAVREGDEDMAVQTVLQLSRSRRIFAPLAFVVGGIAMLFNGVKLLFSNWKLTLVQILPAMWIWVAMLDLKAHALHGRSFHVLRGPILIGPILAITALTAASFFLNAVFAFAIVQPGAPQVRPAFASARAHLKAILVPGIVVGLALAWSTMIVTRWGSPVVRAVAGDRGRRDDGRLRGGAGAADRCEAEAHARARSSRRAPWAGRSGPWSARRPTCSVASGS